MKVVGSCEHGNELSGSVKCGEFLEITSGYQLRKKDSAMWIFYYYNDLDKQGSHDT
jgi:hypothetical protein